VRYIKSGRKRDEFKKELPLLKVREFVEYEYIWENTATGRGLIGFKKEKRFKILTKRKKMV
jgi:hypothetical protein